MKKGFTLVELAIVLVIIGLVVGGVLAGQELVKQAKIRNHIKKLSEISLAFYAFQGKYDGVPGDIIRPERFFPTCTTELDGDTEVTGNGDGFIGGFGHPEFPCFWLHLYNSGLYFAPAPSIGEVDNADPDNPSPPRKIDFLEDSYYYALWDRNIMMFVDSNAGGDPSLQGIRNYIRAEFSHNFPDRIKQAVSPAYMYALDSKIDDGKPYSGVLRAGGSKCFTGDDGGSWSPQEDSEYIYTEEDKIFCQLLYMLN